MTNAQRAIYQPDEDDMSKTAHYRQIKAQYAHHGEAYARWIAYQIAILGAPF